jgi:hypothetical protein
MEYISVENTILHYTYLVQIKHHYLKNCAETLPLFGRNLVNSISTKSPTTTKTLYSVANLNFLVQHFGWGKIPLSLRPKSVRLLHSY